jgi:glutathione S-transferase
MKLYGSLTSPFVRRVRIVATELGVAFERVDTVSDEGQKTLRALNPIWKAPVAEIDGEVVFDSHIIIEHLLRRHGYGPLRTAGGAAWLREQNLVSAIDGALDSAVNLFQLGREGVDLDSAAFLVKQRERVDSILTWVEGKLRGIWLTDEPRLGVAEIALITSLQWMIFRKRYPVEEHAALQKFVDGHADRASIRDTAPSD